MEDKVEKQIQETERKILDIKSTKRDLQNVLETLRSSKTTTSEVTSIKQKQEEYYEELLNHQETLLTKYRNERLALKETRIHEALKAADAKAFKEIQEHLTVQINQLRNLQTTKYHSVHQMTSDLKELQQKQVNDQKHLLDNLTDIEDLKAHLHARESKC